MQQCDYLLQTIQIGPLPGKTGPESTWQGVYGGVSASVSQPN